MEKKTRLHIFSALKYHDYRLLWLGQGISLIGTQMQMVGVNWHMYQLTKSPAMLGVLGLSRFIPILIFGLIAGSFADSRNRKKLLVITQSLMAIFSLLLVVATHVQVITPFLIIALSIAIAMANSFDMPARQALATGLVDRKDLAHAISIGNIMFYIASITGPALSGFVIAKAGVEGVYLFNTLSFLGVIVALFRIHHSGEVSGGTSRSFSFQSVVEGVRFVRSKTIIWSTMLLDFFSTFFASASALLPVFAQTILHVGPVGLGLLYAAESIGAVIATVGLVQMGKVRQQGKVLLSAVVVYAIGTILFGFSHMFALSFLGLLLIGAGDGVSAIIRNNIRHLATPDYIRGRMTAINMIFFMGGPQLGEFEAGILAAAIGASSSVVIGGVGTLLVVAVMASIIPVLRNYENQDEIL